MYESLFQLYSELIKKESWKYYSIPNPNISILQDYSHGKSFMSSYLGKGGKSDLELFHYIDHLTENRVLHIISVFFLGILLYRKSKKINESINRIIKTIPTESTDALDERFKYIWMLICLFHDLGYAVEDGYISFNENDFDAYIKRMPRRPINLPSVYNKELLKRYNEFRKCRYGKNDHGIIGGIKLFSDLCELRRRKELYGNGLYWKKSLENDFGLASWTIACHNVYFIDEKDGNIPCYRHFQLDKLVYSGQSRTINIKKNALFFLFCLVDSIEPLKKVLDIKQLDNISLEFDDESIVMDYGKLSMVYKEDYRNTIQKLNNWLTDVSNDGTIIKI